MKKIIIGIAILIAVIASGVAIYKTTDEIPLGGTSVFQKQSFTEGLFAGSNRQFEVDRAGNTITGGGKYATTTNGNGTFTAAQICDNSLIVATPNIGAVTLTMPTSAQLFADCLPFIGMEKSIRIQNASTTSSAATVITLADGTGGDHQEQEGQTTVFQGTEWAVVKFMNIDGTNHLMDVTVTQVAD